MRKKHPYLTRKRFPGDWPSVELVKLHIRNHRKSENRKARRAALSESLRGESDEHSPSDEDDNEDDDEEIGEQE